MKLFKSSLIALALTSVTSVHAASLAIINATVHTVTDQGVLANATVIVENGKITAINPAKVSADETFDAQGKILTPGLIGSMNGLGLVEVSAVADSRDGGEDKADITFDPSVAFNPHSTAIPFARKGGITRDVVSPNGGESMFKGLTFTADLSGSFDSVSAVQNGVVIEVGAQSKGSRATSLQTLAFKLEDATKALAKAKNTKDKKDKDNEVKRDEQIINDVLSGKKPLIAYVDRSTDILALIKLKQQYNLSLVLVGADDAVLVADEIAKAKVPVILNAMSNLPSSFDTLHASLENAAKLNAAGVKVALSVGDAHNLYQLRYSAGNAVANGLPSADALAAVTANVADIFNIDAGRIAVGKRADLVLWSADPFELSTIVDKLWIDGKEVSTESRQDKLFKRYTTDSDMPRAYTK